MEASDSSSLENNAIICSSIKMILKIYFYSCEKTPGTLIMKVDKFYSNII